MSPSFAPPLLAVSLLTFALPLLAVSLLTFALPLLVVCVLVFAPAPARAQHYVATADTALPRLRFADSLTSVNDRCVVTQHKLNPQIPPVYVNGRPVGFC